MEQGSQNRDRLGQVIVVAVDLTEASDAALLSGVRLARAGDSLFVVHAVESHLLGEARRIADESRLLEKDPGEVRDYFRAVCVGAGDWPVVDTMFHSCIGSPVEAIVQFTVDVEAHVLICGTHARHGLDHALHGSVAESLVREAHCPVLVAKPRSYESCTKSERAAEVCADCAETRAKTGDPAAWCPVHARAHMATHSYGATESRGPHPASFIIPD